MRYAFRTLRRSPGFVTVALLTLALGIGANTAIFSFVDGVLLKPLPYHDPHSIVLVWEKPPGSKRNGISALNYLDWKKQNTVFEKMAAITFGGSVTLTGKDEPVQLRGARVSAPYFEIFGVSAALGRTFAAEEDELGKSQVVVLSHRLWESRFGGDRSIIGRTLILNGKPHTVIGVLPASSAFDRTRVQLWTPLAFEPRDLTRDYHWLVSYARLKPGITIEKAQAEMDTVGARIAQAYPDSNKGWGVTVERVEDQIVGPQLRQSLYVLLAAVGAILLIGCANLANLTLARGTAREREIAVRASLGASRWRLIRQVLTENIVLSFAGGLLGLALGYVLIQGLNRLMPPFYLPREADVSIDWGILLFTFAISIATGLLFGLAPAIHATKTDLTSSIKEDGRSATTGTSRVRLRSALIVTEVALAFMLLTGAGLLIRSFYQLQQLDMGVESTNVITMGLPIPRTKFAEPEQLQTYLRRIDEGVMSLPGVRDVAFTNALPMEGGGDGMPFYIAEREQASRSERQSCFFKRVSPSYFRALGMRVRRGRPLTEADMKGSPPVIVINESMADRYFKGQEPIGKRIMVQEILYGRPGLGPEIPWQVAGVVRDEQVFGIGNRKNPGMYVSYAQSPTTDVNMIVRGAVNPETLQQGIRGAVYAVDKEQPLTDVRTIDQIKSESIAPNRLRTTLLAVFAGLALLLASIGIYGVISYSVAQRTHELGLRAALGATKTNLLVLVLRSGLLLAIIGLAFGIAGSMVLARLLSALLFGVGPYDPATMGSVTVILLSVAALACYLPARRAAKVDPMVALRYE